MSHGSQALAAYTCPYPSHVSISAASGCGRGFFTYRTLIASVCPQATQWVATIGCCCWAEPGLDPKSRLPLDMW